MYNLCETEETASDQGLEQIEKSGIYWNNGVYIQNAGHVNLWGKNEM